MVFCIFVLVYAIKVALRNVLFLCHILYDCLLTGYVRICSTGQVRAIQPIPARDTMNVKTTIQGDKLIIEVDVSKATIDSAPRSKSGKSQMVASTNGFAAVGPVKVSLNVIA